MAGNPRIKKTSVAGFLFMPQFRLCFQGFSHIVPVFMRTLAVMFEQAGLIARNHPAMRYGMTGVRRCGFGDLMGEAWVTLKASPASPFQWGIFASVVLMVTLMLASVAMAVLTVCFGFGTAARAQLFGLVNADGSPKDTAGTTASGMPDASGGGFGMFDKTIPGAGDNLGHGDYGIMILDKMLRQGMQGVGAPLQNGMQALMALYNSGIMVVAGIMLAWAILSVVVDAAKTGTVGGGRHNLVWAPIRIVFALGLLVPLGPTGYSSGQFMVVKLAEWGSNLGTNAWGDYLGAVAADSLVVDQTPNNGTALMRAWVDMWICRVAYNSITYDSVLGIPADQEVKRAINYNSSQGGNDSMSYTNATNGNMCGTVSAANPDADTVLQAALADPDLTSRAIATFKRDMGRAYYQLFFSGPFSNPVFEPPAGTPNKAREFACGFVSQHVIGEDKDVASSPLLLSGQCTDAEIQACIMGPFPADKGPGTGNGPWPDTACMDELIATYYTTINTAMVTAQGTLKTAIANNIKASMTARGWPDMGRWFLQIAQMNAITVSAKSPSVNIAPGIIAHTEIDLSGMSDTRGMGYYTQSDLDRTMNRIANRYKEWWENADAIYGGGAIPAQVPVNAGGPLTKPDPSKIAAEVGSTSAGAASFKNPAGLSTEGVLDKIAKIIPGITVNPFVEIVYPGNPDIYPFSQIAAFGSEVFWWGVTCATVPSLLLIILALATPDLASVLAGSPLFDILTMLGTTLILAGGMLKFYVPILPFIRVAFAVLTWMVSVFEAVMMVPVAALAHISTQGDGLAGQAKQAWMLWLNVLLRPVLTVLGYVGAIMVFNTFVIYFHDAFVRAVQSNYSSDGFLGMLNGIAMSLIYAFMIYTIANSAFKMLDLVPNALMKWLGGHADQSFDESHAVAGGLQYAAGMAGKLNDQITKNTRDFVKSKQKKPDEGGGKPGSGAKSGEGGEGGEGGGGPDANQPHVPQADRPDGPSDGGGKPSAFEKTLGNFDKQTETARSSMVKQGASAKDLTDFDHKTSTMRDRSVAREAASESKGGGGAGKGPILPSHNIKIGKAKDEPAPPPDSSGPIKGD